jgi:hypothetical protein
MKKLLLPAVTLFTLLTASVSFAEPVEFKQADANADGMVDQAEFANSGIKKKMADLDSNKDGKLNADEYEVVFEEECE